MSPRVLGGLLAWLGAVLVAAAVLIGLAWLLDALGRPRYREQASAGQTVSVEMRVEPVGLHAWRGEASWSPVLAGWVAA